MNAKIAPLKFAALLLLLGCRQQRPSTWEDGGGPTPPKGPVETLLSAAKGCRGAMACDGIKGWVGESALFEGGRSDKELVTLLAREDEGGRVLAAEKLQTFGVHVSRDPALIATVLEQAERETHAKVGVALGEILSRVDLEEFRDFPKLRRVVVDHKLVPLRAQFAKRLLRHNPRSRKGLEMLRDLAQDPSSEMTNAVALGLWEGASLFREDACSLWLKLDERAEGEGLPSELFARSGYCEASRSELLLRLSARAAKSGLARGEISALRYTCEDKAAAPAHKAKARDLLKKMGEEGQKRRLLACEALVLCDAKEGQKCLDLLAQSKDREEQNGAKRVSFPAHPSVEHDL